jgi:hypothetical protein
VGAAFEQQQVFAAAATAAAAASSRRDAAGALPLLAVQRGGPGHDPYCKPNNHLYKVRARAGLPTHPPPPLPRLQGCRAAPSLLRS